MSSRGKLAVKASLKKSNRSKRVSPLDDAAYWCEAGLDRDGLESRFIDSNIGYGVFATSAFHKGSFLLEYCGDRITPEEAEEKEKKRKSRRSYVFYYNWNGEHAIDATKWSDRLCRFVNDEKIGYPKNNSAMKLKVINGYPRLCLFATRDININEELRYDYGDNDLPWREDTRKRKKMKKTEIMDDDPFDVRRDLLKGKHERVDVEDPDYNPEKISDLDGSNGSYTESDHFSEGIDCTEIEMEVGKNQLGTDLEVEKNQLGTDLEVEKNQLGTDLEVEKTQPVEGIEFENNKISAGFHVENTQTAADISVEKNQIEDSESNSEEDLMDDLIEEDLTDVDSVVDPDYNPEKMSDSESSDGSCSESDHFSEGNACTEKEMEVGKNQLGTDLEVEKNQLEDTTCHHVSDSEQFSDDSEVVAVPRKEKVICLQGIKKNTQGTVLNKVHACFYCEKVMANMARHLELSHRNEFEVSKILLHPKKSKERRKLWEEIVNKGDFAHNIAVLEKGSGLIIPKRRVGEGDVNSLVPCHKCKAFYSRTELWRHSQYCVCKDDENSTISNPVKNGKLLLPLKNCGFSDLSEKVLAVMRDDEVKLAVSSDHRISDYGKRLLDRVGSDPHIIHYISQKLRELGRLLLSCKQASKEIVCLDDILLGKNWDLMIHCVKDVCGYDRSTRSYKTPSLALKIGQSLNKCARYLRSEGRKEDNTKKISIAENFMDQYKDDWNDEISGQALTSLGDKKYNKPLLLPLVEDVVKLNKYLASEIKAVCADIKDNFTCELYSKLAQMCLALVILFNRRRSGEAERMTLKSFRNACSENRNGKPDPVVMSTLSEFEKNLCNSHTRVEIKGKRGRKVAVLLTEDMKKSINTLISVRDKAKINDDMLFSKPGESKLPFRGSDCLRKYSIEVGIEDTKSITSTKLRKQLATLAQILNLSETSQDILATFQGHNIRVHRQYYRLPEDALQVAKVSKVLHSLNSGTISQFQGKDLDDIKLDDKEVVESEEDSEEEEDQHDQYEENDSDLYDQCEESDSQAKGTKGKKTEKKMAKKLQRGTSATRHVWTTPEKEAIKRQMGKFIREEKTPGQLPCLNAIRNEPLLAKYPWQRIKHATRNLIVSRKKQMLKRFPQS